MDESNNDSVKVNCCIDPENQHNCELEDEEQVLIYNISIANSILTINAIVDDINQVPAYEALFKNTNGLFRTREL